MKKLYLLCVVVCLPMLASAQCLNGTYTIGGASPDYPTFGAALSAVISNGVCGPVVFNARPGTYNEQLNIPQIASANATNTITFQSENGDSSSVILAYTSTLSTANYVVRFNGADYFRFSEITLRATATAAYTRVVELTNNANFNSIANCSIEGLFIANASDQFALVYSGGSNDVGNSFLNNRMLNGSAGFVLSGVSTSSTESGVMIDGNDLTGQYAGGMYLQYLNAPVVSHNSVFTTNLGNFIFYGVELYYCVGQYQVFGNNFLEGGIYILFTSGTVANPGLIWNNFVQCSKSNGIFLNTSSYSSMYYNNVRINPLAPYTPLLISNTANGHILRNNILSNENGGYAINKSVQVINSDYNDLYTTGANLVFSAGAYPTLGAWSTASGNDQNSFSVDPQFYSPNDLHVLNASLNDEGTPVAGITNDFDLQPRSVATPDIGADEFNPIADDAGVSAIAGFCSGTVPVVVTLHNYGTSTLTSAVIQWTVNAVAQTPYTWSGSLAAAGSVQVIAGNYTFNSVATYTIKAWSEMPNAVPDPAAWNDTTTYVTASALSGAFTIGGAAPDYPTIDSAVTDLSARGVCGPVIFNLRPGTYNEQNVIPPITGASAVNTITFQSENGDSSSVDITWSAIGTAATNYIIDLNGADYIHFSKLTFTRTGPSGFGTLIRIGQRANHNVVTNCQLIGQPTTINASNRVLIFGDYSGDSSNVVQNNLFIDGYGAIYLGGNAALSVQGANYIRCNVFTNQYAYAASCDGESDLRLDSNVIYTDSASSASAAITLSSGGGVPYIRGNMISGVWTDGIRFSYMTCDFVMERNTINSSSSKGIAGTNSTGNFVITKNDIHVSGTALDITTSNGTGAPGVLIANNFLIGANGANILYLNYLRFYHNSIRANGPMTNNYGLQIYSNLADTVRNNIISNEGGGLAIRYWGTIQFDHNFYYHTGPTFGYSWSTGLYVTYQQYMAQAPDNSSTWSLTPYIDSTDLHIYYKPDYFGVCSITPDVTEDIDDQSRHLVYPWPGADEFMYAPDDAAATDVDTVTQANCTMSNPVIVTIQNAGGQTLNSVQINWSVDGILQTPYVWTGSLPSLQYQTAINIGTFTIATNTPNQLVKIWTSLPNGNPDTLNLYDTTYTWFTPKLAGIYTIGGNAPDYTTMDGAISDLVARGICGNVTFNIRDGIYPVTDTLYAVNGAAANARITFQSENLDSSLVTIQAMNQNVIYLNGADYFTFNELTFEVIENFTPTSDCHPVRIANDANYNRILNCRLIGDANINTASYAGQFACLYSPGNCHHNLYRDNYMTGGLLGVYFSQYQQTVMVGMSDTLDGNIIEVGTVPNFGYGYGMEIENHDSLVLTDNRVIGWNCIFEQLDQALMAGNIFEGQIVFDQANDLEFRNNFTSMFAIGGASDSILIRHNTMVVTQNYPAFTTLNIVGGVTNVVLQNNIIVNYYGGTAMDVYLNINNWNYLTADHNNYYTTGPDIINSSGAYSLASWQAASGRDLNSNNINPPFLSATDFHLSNSPQLSNGMPLPIADDIDHDIRSATNPDIGADEFSPASGNFDGALADVFMQSQLCYGTQNVDVRLYNNETQVSMTSAVVNWKVNGIVQTPYNWIGSVPAGDTSSPVTIGNYFFSGNTTYTITAWISQPNGFSGLNTSNDTAQFTTFVLLPVSLGADTVICEGNTLTLNAGLFTDYLWSTADTTQTIIVSGPGNYFVTVADANGCVTADTINVDVPIAYIGADTSACTGQTIVLGTGYSFITQVWSTGATTSTINVTTTGTFAVTGTGANGCQSQDTILVTFNPSPVVDLGNDTIICANSYLWLDAGPGGTSYYWQPSTNTGQTELSAGGNFGVPEIYSVVVTNSFGCSGTDSILIYDKFDTIGVTCNGNSLILDGGSNYVSWAWSNSSGLYGTTQTVVVTVPDVYTVIALDANGCGVASQINITSIAGLPTAAFSYSPSGQTITFNNSSGNATTYLWNFGDSQTSTQLSPSHTYATPGTYTVTLIATNSCGSDTVTQVITIVGVSENNSMFAFMVYPNPTDGQFSVWISAGAGEQFTITLRDQAGREIQSIATTVNNTAQISFNEVLAAGVYLIECVNENGERCVRQLIVQ